MKSFPLLDRLFLWRILWTCFKMLFFSLPQPSRGDFSLILTMRNLWGVNLGKCYQPPQTRPPGVLNSQTSPQSASSNLFNLPFKCLYQFLTSLPSTLVSLSIFSVFNILSSFLDECPLASVSQGSRKSPLFFRLFNFYFVEREE